jgi:iron(III) transport system substrate-binding protein
MRGPFVSRFWVFVLPMVALLLVSTLVLARRSNRGLILYSAMSYSQPVADEFTRATGVPITVVELTTGNLLARVAAEARHPSWDIAWFDGDMAAAGLDDAHLLAKGITPALHWTTQGRELLPRDGSYVPTGFTLAGVFVSLGSIPDMPHRWQDLLTVRGCVGMNNPSISGPSYPILVAILNESGGWPAGKRFIDKLKARCFETFTANNDTLAALRSGAIRVAIVQSSAAWSLRARDNRLVVSVPRPAYVLPSVIVEPRTASSQTRATVRRFIAFAMSDRIQHLRMLQGGSDGVYRSTVAMTGAGSPRIARSDGPLKTTDAFEWGKIEGEVNAWFAASVTR